MKIQCSKTVGEKLTEPKSRSEQKMSQSYQEICDSFRQTLRVSHQLITIPQESRSFEPALPNDPAPRTKK